MAAIIFKNNPTANQRLVSPFGYRASTGTNHAGVDLGPVKRAVPGDALLAVNDAIVKISKVNNGGLTVGLGNYVVLEHKDLSGQPWCTLYGHQLALEVKVGQVVKAGQVIGHMGHTGKCIPEGPGGTHTHFEVRECSAAAYFTTKAINPAQFFKAVVVPAGPTVKYEVTEEERAAVDKCVKAGIIASPDYWLKLMETTQYLDQLFLNFSRRL